VIACFVEMKPRARIIQRISG